MSEIAAALREGLAERYRIERELGAGGMATVYLAHDIKHDRLVALKVLRPELAAVIGAERFLAEIRTTANLQHPHILPLFDSGSAGSFLFYVMPYVEGETLRGKLTRERQLGVEESVRLIRDVADALDYAHRHGVIHRDIKPENILVHDGRPVVADFGIALAVKAAGGGRMTETGLSLGTPHYMSPEQATADRDLSARSDIYSLACVLYEMLAGDPPHTGPSPQAILMRILTDAPRPVDEIRTTVPPHVSMALSKALEKLPADRFESAKAFGEALVTDGFTYSQRTPTRGMTAGVAPQRARPAGRRALAATGAVAAVAIVAALWGWLRPEPEAPVVRLDLSTGDVSAVFANDLVISPDGALLALSGTLPGGDRGIFLRRLDGDAAFRMVPGTESGVAPSFSPDSRWIVFRRSSDASLVKVAVAGGGSITLLPGGPIAPFAPRWTADGMITFNGPQGAFRMPAAGGPPVRLPMAMGSASLLPDGSGMLITRDGNVMLLDFATESVTVLVPNALHPTYVKTGHLLYVADGDGLFAVEFDPERRAISGTPVRVLERVGHAANAFGYAVSENGTLVYRDGPALAGGTGAPTRLVIVGFDGRADTIPLPGARRLVPRFAPNGRTIAFEFVSSRNGLTDIYTFDLVSGTNTQLTFDGDNDDPIWSPDGRRIVFNKAVTETGEDLYIKLADNSAPETPLLTAPGSQWPSGWIRGETVLFSTQTGGATPDLATLSLASGAKPVPYLAAPWSETDMQVSPDGGFAVFESLEAGEPAIWLRDFPEAKGKWRVSPGQGRYPRWSPDGRHVYWVKAGQPLDSVQRARVDRTGGAVVVRSPETMSVLNIAGIGNWDLHPDGRRFIAAIDDAAQPSGGVSQESRYLVVLNWFTELRRLTSIERP